MESLIKHDWHLWAVRIKKTRPAKGTHSHFLSCGGDSPVAMFFERKSAVNHAKNLGAYGFNDVSIVRIRTKVEEVAKPSRRGLAK